MFTFNLLLYYFTNSCIFLYQIMKISCLIIAAIFCIILNMVTAKTASQPGSMLLTKLMKSSNRSKFAFQFAMDPAYWIHLFYNLESAYWTPFKALIKPYLNFYGIPNRRWFQDKRFKIPQFINSK